MLDEVVIVSAVRTPIGKLNGALSSLSAVELGTRAAQAALKRGHVDPQSVDQVIFGNVLQAGSGQNVARQIELNSGIPVTSTAMTINQVCGSSMKAIHLGQTAIQVGDADVVLVGGTESMSQSPYLVPDMRTGHKFGSLELTDSMEHDGLTDAFNHYPMGITAENVADQFHVSRDQQDQFALASHMKAAAARESGRFTDEIVPVTVQTRQGPVIVSTDEAIRPDTSLEKLARLSPSFKPDGTVTAGNAAGINDGAAALILMRRSLADARHIPYQAVIRGYQETGIDPAIMGYAPVQTIPALLARTQTDQKAVGRFEVNEAFASQSVAIERDLALPTDKLNVNGGAIALGHPIGMTGARLIVTLLYDLIHDNETTGVAAMCVGGGMGTAMQIERTPTTSV
ncbi:acetyl-CoA C-acetyltransferase [Levilactobacillus bambusae]|uniref:acetyl-CoA C-acetyltransferase n=1 Tax=Levilactobacillus bambusae TaxID=2024736 RepID=A0A2V1N021_9LACO|nr:acetyl-CoA C-acetyltransferase [Levilactobacillus bambusae]PWG00564.1 acetyl-CoA C-acyltransferase [Levilactobacillus bambusae]